MLPIKTILYPTDFSTASEYAFRIACSLANDHNAKLVILHVEPLPLAYGEIMPPPPPEDHTEMLWESFRKLQAKEPKVRELNVETKLAEGDPVDEILRLARECECGMIVMGTHGRTGLKRVLLGSVAELVLRKAPCPVLTVKEPRVAPAPVETKEEEPVLATPY